MLNGLSKVIYFKRVVATLTGLVPWEQEAIGSCKKKILLHILEDFL